MSQSNRKLGASLFHPSRITTKEPTLWEKAMRVKKPNGDGTGKVRYVPLAGLQCSACTGTHKARLMDNPGATTPRYPSSCGECLQTRHIRRPVPAYRLGAYAGDRPGHYAAFRSIRISRWPSHSSDRPYLASCDM